LARENRFRVSRAAAKGADFRRFRPDEPVDGVQRVSQRRAHGGGKPAPAAGFGAETPLQCAPTQAGRRRRGQAGRDGETRHGGGLRVARRMPHCPPPAAGLTS
jgi:hypothetical protein